MKVLFCKIQNLFWKSDYFPLKGTIWEKKSHPKSFFNFLIKRKRWQSMTVHSLQPGIIIVDDSSLCSVTLCSASAAMWTAWHPDITHPQESNLLGETLKLIILSRACRLHAKLMAFSIRIQSLNQWNNPEKFCTLLMSPILVHHMVNKFYIYYRKTLLFHWVMSPIQCSVTPLNINKRLWEKRGPISKKERNAKLKKPTNQSLAGWQMCCCYTQAAGQSSDHWPG